MFRIHQKSQGITLLEILLVFAIAASITLLGIRQYQTYKRGADIEQIKFNVETLFQAMSQFYQSQCDIRADSNTPGILNPLSNPPQYQMVDIINDLSNNHYLTRNVGTFLYGSPYVESSGPGYQGYIVQFNREPDQQRMQCTVGNGASGPTISQNCTSSTQIATIVTWSAQVAVHVNADNATNLKNLLGADCVSNASGNTVLPCSLGASATGSYLVWRRTPNTALRNEQNPLWQTMPSISQFKQMYTTYPTTLLVNTSGTIPGGGTQYILCGG